MIKESTIEKTHLPDGWLIKTLKEVCAKITDGTHQTPKYFDDGVIFLSSKNVTSGKIDWNNVKYIDAKQHLEMHKRVAPRLKDILLAKNGTTGVAAMVDKDVIFDIYVSLAHIRVLDEIEPEFMLYFINSPIAKTQFNKRLKGAGVPNLHLQEIREVEIPFPKSLTQQKQIVSILDKAFAAIDKAKANAEQNLQNAKELFESYLQEVFKNTETGWEEKTLGKVCKKIQDGAHHSPKKLYPHKATGLFPYITSKNVKNNYMDLSKLQYVDEAFHETIYPRCKPSIGDVLLTKDGAKTGNVTLNTLDEPFSLLSSVCLIKTDEKELRPDFLKYYIQSPIGFKSITGKMTGAAIKRIILRAIKSAKIPLPHIDKQKELVAKIDSLLTHSQKLQSIYTKKINDLEELKKSILQRAFSGQLTTN